MTLESRRTKTGRCLLSMAMILTIVASIGFNWLGWTGHHIFNPEWHPHARFHGAQLSFLIVALSLGCGWLLWRRSVEPRLAVGLVVAVLVLFWAGEFFAFAIPGASPSPVLGQPNTLQLLSVEIHGNLLFSGFVIGLSLLGGVLATPRAEAAATEWTTLSPASGGRP